jgi:hypothetical protein
VQNLHIPNSDKLVAFYSLDVIIAVGYRVKSTNGVRFRQWATEILHEYLQKGFALNDEVLKNLGGGNYFKELLERIRDIRASEKVLYKQVLDLYATSIDYDKDSPKTTEFFKIVQNKLHFASTKHTSAEIIYNRADSDQPYMGLKTFKGSQPVKQEVTVAKNYLEEKELQTLRRIVSAFFDMAELQAQNEQPMYMQDWIDSLDRFCTSFGLGVLDNAGTVSAIQAREKALEEFDKYKAQLPLKSSSIELDYLNSLNNLKELTTKTGNK